MGSFVTAFPLSMMFSRLIHFVHCISTSLIFFIVKKYFTVWICPFLCIHSSIDGHLDHFHHLAIVNNAAVIVCVHVFA